MAKAIDTSSSTTQAMVGARPLHMLAILRLSLGFVVLLGSTLFILGGSWDIEWHSVIGRDRTLIPPHQLMLAGITISGLAALVAVLAETFLARRNTEIAANSTSFADLFYAPLGAYLAGFAALSAGIGFVLDSYWHALYGIDVVLWAPFHVMLIAGAGIASLGGAYMLVSAAHLAEREGNKGLERSAYIGAVIGFAVMLGFLAILLLDGYSRNGNVDLGFVSINLYSIIAAPIGMWMLYTTAAALPWRWSTTYVILVYLVIAGIVLLFVPPSINQLALSEHLSFRKPPRAIPEVTLVWPLGILYVALVFDFLRRRAQRNNWSERKMTILTALITLPGWAPIALVIPWSFIYIIDRVGIPGFLLSLLLGLVGSFAGIWLGQRTGESIFEQGREA